MNRAMKSARGASAPSGMRETWMRNGNLWKSGSSRQDKLVIEGRREIYPSAGI